MFITLELQEYLTLHNILIKYSSYQLIKSLSDYMHSLKVFFQQMKSIPFSISQHTYVIGQNDRAQLGLGYSTSHMRKPTLLKHSFTNYVGCEHYTYAQGSDGLYFWGKADYGCAPTRKRVDEPILTRAGQVECMSASNSRFHFIENKDLYGVGLIIHLGIKMNKISTSKPLLIKSNIIQVACSQHHTLCLDEDGDVYAWGSAINGELGIRQEGYNFKQFFSTPVKIGELNHISKIACADHYSLALSKKGIIYEWGKGYLNLSFEQAILIKKVEIQGHSIDISCSNTRSACIDQLGRLYQWNQQGIVAVPTPLRCENFVCGEDVLLFIGQKRMRRVSEHFKSNVRIKLQEIKDFVEKKNSKIKNMFYDENRKIRCLSEINRKSVDKTPLSIEDFMQSRKVIKRKQSLYMINLQSQPSVDINSIIKNKKLSRKLSTKQLSQENIASLPEIQEYNKSKISLKLINPKLKDALIFDEVNDAILESERQNPIYIPYEQREKKDKIIDQPNSKAQQQPSEVTKYEYIKRIENGFQNRLIQDNVQMEEDKVVIAYKQTRQYKHDTALYQNKYKRMKAVLDKKQSEMKLLLQDQQ